MNDLGQIWEELSKHGRVLFLKVDFDQDENSPHNNVLAVYKTLDQANQAIQSLNDKNIWGQKIQAKLSPIPTPLKD
jgi:hypothetical protein